MQKTLSIVIPCYNEALTIQSTVTALVDFLQKTNYRYEIILINDGSLDRTWSIMKSLAHQNSYIKSINLSKNMGKEIAMTVGAQHAIGDAIIFTDGDGQRPISMIHDFVYKRES